MPSIALEGNNLMDQYRLQVKELESSFAEKDSGVLVDTELADAPLAAKAAKQPPGLH